MENHRTIIKSFNSTWSFVFRCASLANQNKINNLDEVQQIYNSLSWSLISPGMILASAYVYLVYTKENDLLKQYSDVFKNTQLLNQLEILQDERDFTNEKNKAKAKSTLKVLRNSIAHGAVEYEDKKDPNNPKDGDLFFIFTDTCVYGKDKGKIIKIKLSLPDFGNFVEELGQAAIKRNLTKSIHLTVSRAEIGAENGK